MRLNPEYLTQHYASLSDEALLETKRSDLTELAQTYYDDEVKRRGLSPGGKKPRAGAKTEVPRLSEQSDEYAGPDEEKPSWIDDAAEVFSITILPGTNATGDAADARRVLEAAGIPCYLEARQIPKDEPSRLLRKLRSGDYWFPASLTCRLAAFWTATFSTSSSKTPGERTSKGCPMNKCSP